MASTKQIRMLRAGFSKTGTMNYYGDMLAEFGVETDRDLSNEQVGAVLDKLRGLGYQVKINKHSAPKTERAGMITSKQIELLKRTWRGNSHVVSKDDLSLLKFAQRICRVDSLDWIPRQDVSKLLNAIINIKAKVTA